MNSPTVLRTARLVLRALAAGDRAEYVRVHEVNREFWGAWTSDGPAGETVQSMFERRLAESDMSHADGDACRLVGFAADGRIAGFCGLSHIVRSAFQNAYIGWFISVEFARRGIATEAVGALLDHAFAPAPAGLGLHRVQANIRLENAASVAFAEKLGFRREGLARRYLKIAGDWRDHFMYAKLAEEHLSIPPRSSPDRPDV